MSPTPRRLRRIFALDDFEPAARRHLPRPVFGYVASASETNASRDDNRAAFAEIGLLPRVGIDVTDRRLGAEVMGLSYDMPFGIAPMGVSALTAYRGDIVLARAAERAGIPMVISAASLIPLEEIRAEAPGVWYQAYLPNGWEEKVALLERVARAGIDTLVITVDSSVGPSPENNLRAGWSTPIRPSLPLLWQGMTHPRWAIGTFLRTFFRHGPPHFENAYARQGAPLLSRQAVRDFSGRQSLSWEVLERLRQEWRGRYIIKGVNRPDDAARAQAIGADGVILSNHGGRQLDGAVSPMRVLRAARAAAPGLALMLDGGIRRGTDILKALALGADFVFVGRPFNYAASIGGEAGVDHAIGLLRKELLADIGMLGPLRPADLGPELLDLGRFREAAPG